MECRPPLRCDVETVITSMRGVYAWRRWKVERGQAAEEGRLTAWTGGEGKESNIEMIRERAYELFLARGATHGADLADWFEAEQDLRTASQR